jgi:hypothetical protein
MILLELLNLGNWYKIINTVFAFSETKHKLLLIPTIDNKETAFIATNKIQSKKQI